MSTLLVACGGVTDSGVFSGPPDVDADPREPELRPGPASSGPPEMVPFGVVPAPTSGGLGLPSMASDSVDRGPCAGLPMAVIADGVRMRFLELADIQQYRSFGDSPVRTTLPLSVKDPERSYWGAQFNAERVVDLVFYRGTDGCDDQSCRSESFWYFQTGVSCQAELVGSYQRILRGDCFESRGEALWSIPMADPLTDCSANLEPQSIAGRYLVQAVGAPSNACGALPRPGDGVLLDIAQEGNDLSRATVALDGTTSSFVDGKSIPARVEQRNLSATHSFAQAAPCKPLASIELHFSPDGYFLPGTVGELSITATADPNCPKTEQNCDQSIRALLVSPVKLP